MLISQKGGKETILEEELEFKGIEEEEEETHADERSSAEGDKDKGEQRVLIFVFLFFLSFWVLLDDFMLPDPLVTESKEAAAPAAGDSETKPAPSSPSPPVHSSPPLMEPRPKAPPAVENPQKNSLPVQASSAPTEGTPLFWMLLDQM